MACSPWNIYNEFKFTLGKKTIDLVNDVFKCALFTGGSNVGDVTLLNAWYATATNEVSSANGYTTAGVTVTMTWSGDHTLAIKTLTSTAAAWTASGAGITAYFAVLYDNTTANKDLLGWCYLDQTPLAVLANSGQVLTVTISANGIWTVQ